MRVIFPMIPMGKPRQTQSDKWKKRPCVLAWRYFADQMRAIAERERFKIPDQGVSITFYLPMPRSWSAREKEQNRGAPHRQKPDLDNCIKAVFDALREDDCAIWHLQSAEKRWADTGSIVIEVAA